MIKREDLLHPEVSGNKWRKLKYNLRAAKIEGYSTVLTFGGAYSNHIYATAAAAAAAGLQCIGVIRGEVHLPLNATLQFASSKGMTLQYMDRESYKRKGTKAVLEQLKEKFGKFYLIPEGGTNALAIRGCKEIIEEIKAPFDYICSSVGTGGTLSGLITGLKGQKKLLGFPALKGEFLTGEIKAFLKENGEVDYENWEIIKGYHFGGYAKIKPGLIDFIRDFKEKHEILLDPIYTGKMMYGLFDLITAGYFPKGTVIVALHTGGLQGWQGIKERHGMRYDFEFL